MKSLGAAIQESRTQVKFKLFHVEPKGAAARFGVEIAGSSAAGGSLQVEDPKAMIAPGLRTIHMDFPGPFFLLLSSLNGDDFSALNLGEIGQHSAVINVGF